MEEQPKEFSFPYRRSGPSLPSRSPSPPLVYRSNWSSRYAKELEPVRSGTSDDSREPEWATRETKKLFSAVYRRHGSFKERRELNIRYKHVGCEQCAAKGKPCPVRATALQCGSCPPYVKCSRVPVLKMLRVLDIMKISEEQYDWLLDWFKRSAEEAVLRDIREQALLHVPHAGPSRTRPELLLSPNFFDKGRKYTAQTSLAPVSETQRKGSPDDDKRLTKITHRVDVPAVRATPENYGVEDSPPSYYASSSPPPNLHYGYNQREYPSYSGYFNNSSSPSYGSSFRPHASSPRFPNENSATKVVYNEMSHSDTVPTAYMNSNSNSLYSGKYMEMNTFASSTQSPLGQTMIAPNNNFLDSDSQQGVKPEDHPSPSLSAHSEQGSPYSSVASMPGPYYQLPVAAEDASPRFRQSESPNDMASPSPVNVNKAHHVYGYHAYISSNEENAELDGQAYYNTDMSMLGPSLKRVPRGDDRSDEA